jgi:transposase
MAELLLNDLPAWTDIIAVKGYDADWIWESNRGSELQPHIPPKSNRYDSITCSKTKHEKHDLVERCFSELKQFRPIASYDRSALNYLAMLKIACFHHGSGRGLLGWAEPSLNA